MENSKKDENRIEVKNYSMKQKEKELLNKFDQGIKL